MDMLRMLDDAIAAQRSFIGVKQRDLQIAISRGLPDETAIARRDLLDAGRVLERLEQERRSNTPCGESRDTSFVGSNF
ncbi:MAG TPA: hypothetical protein VH678_05810 [Xanthobacteraceae bacterium]|jgi:hypothetical protein